jgi:hypothetical protein
MYEHVCMYVCMCIWLSSTPSSTCSGIDAQTLSNPEPDFWVPVLPLNLAAQSGPEGFSFGASDDSRADVSLYL